MKKNWITMSGSEKEVGKGHNNIKIILTYNCQLYYHKYLIVHR